MNYINRFFNWYKTKIVHAVGFLFFTQVIQIPHFVWGADVILRTGTVVNVDPIFDFILYGIDLIEIPSLINVTILFIYELKKRKVNNQ